MPLRLPRRKPRPARRTQRHRATRAAAPSAPPRPARRTAQRAAPPRVPHRPACRAAPRAAPRRVPRRAAPCTRPAPCTRRLRPRRRRVRQPRPPLAPPRWPCPRRLRRYGGGGPSGPRSAPASALHLHMPSASVYALRVPMQVVSLVAGLPSHHLTVLTSYHRRMQGAGADEHIAQSRLLLLTTHCLLPSILYRGRGRTSTSFSTAARPQAPSPSDTPTRTCRYVCASDARDARHSCTAHARHTAGTDSYTAHAQHSTAYARHLQGVP